MPKLTLTTPPDEPPSHAWIEVVVALVLVAIWLVFALTGCSFQSRDFVIERVGNVMVTTEDVTVNVVGPDASGNLVPGRVRLPAGSGVNTSVTVKSATGGLPTSGVNTGGQAASATRKGTR